MAVAAVTVIAAVLSCAFLDRQSSEMGTQQLNEPAGTTLVAVGAAPLHHSIIDAKSQHGVADGDRDALPALGEIGHRSCMDAWSGMKFP